MSRAASWNQALLLELEQSQTEPRDVSVPHVVAIRGDRLYHVCSCIYMDGAQVVKMLFSIENPHLTHAVRVLKIRRRIRTSSPTTGSRGPVSITRFGKRPAHIDARGYISRCWRREGRVAHFWRHGQVFDDWTNYGVDVPFCTCVHVYVCRFMNVYIYICMTDLACAQTCRTY